MRIWLDLANSPQVLFFFPILQELEKRGHRVSITIRDFAQTRELADQSGLSYVALGSHGGRRFAKTVSANLGRARDLARWARSQDFDLGISSNVYSHVAACSMLRLPLVNLYDYDPNPANHLAFRLARRVIVPEAFPDDALKRFGALGKHRKYRGVKEEVYLSDFEPTLDFRMAHDIPDDCVLVVMRPPSDWSPYHRAPNPLFDQLLGYASSQPETHIVFLPRIEEQARAVRALGLENVRIPLEAYVGPDLIFHADLVCSAGGTMNREAAVLGTPVYTVYGGELGATDRYLIDLGRMKHVTAADDFPRIAFEKRVHQSPLARCELVPEIVDLVLE